MNWMLILSQIFEIVILPLLGIGTAYVIALVRAKIQEMKGNKEDALYHKYLDMLNDTIADCVLATTQTYVEALKKEKGMSSDTDGDSIDAIRRLLESKRGSNKQ